ncbi:ATP-dependent RNA helicase DbpA [Photobacterium damselae subsp. piscicida]|nr:ATP-dependent RNA helicase DbpA [Photobacterium damselae subsp. piscicida]
MTQTSFATLNLHPNLLANLASLGYEKMTPIQAQSLPIILAGQDIIAQGKTGSGKTAAFGLGLLNNLNVKRFRVQTLVLCPTRELADQVAKEIRRLARAIHNIKVLTLCGGMPFGPQIGSLEHGAYIIVGTPGRVEEHLRKGNLSLDNLNTLVLDEADRMLEMGFQDAIDAVIDCAPKQRQTLLFSATYPTQIASIANSIMNKPAMVKVEATHDNSSISQHFYKVDNNEERMDAVRLLLAKHHPESAVIFCNTKREAQEVADTLVDEGFSALALHGDLEQRERDRTLVRFANKSCSILVATDVAARGLDIDALDAVINYHLARDTEVHVHRIGRTGRAGSKGIACSLFSDKEHYKVALLEDYLDRPISGEALPDRSVLNQPPYRPAMVTLLIDGGKKQKVRPGDILGALTGGDKSIQSRQVGKIHIFDYCAYVSVQRDIAKAALKKLENGKIKGRNFRARMIRG